MDKHYTITMYFKILDSYRFGGVGSEGYAFNESDIKNNGLKWDILKSIDTTRKLFSRWANVPIENAISVDRQEYIDNVDIEDVESEQIEL